MTLGDQWLSQPFPRSNFDEPAPEEITTMDEGVSDRSPGDLGTSKCTLDLVEDLINPLQTHSLEIDY